MQLVSRLTPDPGIRPTAMPFVNRDGVGQPRRQRMDLSIIIVNWKSTDFLLACLENIKTDVTSARAQIIVVDNASAEDEILRIQNSHADITLIKSERNLGFSRANNLGFRHAIGEYILFLNPDTEPVGTAIDVLLRKIKALPDAGIVGCRLLNSDRTVQLSSIQKFPTVLSQVLDAERLLRLWPGCPLWRLDPLFAPISTPVQVDAISGACMMVRREVFAAVGMLSEDYFMYSEDLDLNYKVRRAGFKNYYVGEAEVIHHGGKSSSRQGSAQWGVIMKCQATLTYFCNTRGRLYGLQYRGAMVCAALVRLFLLGIWYPCDAIAGDGNGTLQALKKWGAVLSWAAGMAGAPIRTEPRSARPRQQT